MSSTWLPSGIAQIRRYWDGDIGGVVFNQVSGDTHFLDALAFELLELADSQTLEIEALSRLLFEDTQALQDGEAHSRVHSALRHLQALGLLQEQLS
ncbi:HPr-rel-A system PqqD family peptide chaperone [Paucibacter sp. PLA-PC-4]|uniref:HPr-rel-A system PqqD family peptide chaperone n=1 Tax=Paucibacter sp. PLA-PC-4 TaxID=2993655 RepID=UPI00224964B0|nr:HPr-rel-A system PqqD family peptide chaperone [Paucibacter sp. PLA-PC-4]MCX2860312.1 HPr-rel-A system PqqD family peptide chaperone [Paucibacter sp. PLA-PC-4]